MTAQTDRHYGLEGAGVGAKSRPSCRIGTIQAYPACMHRSAASSSDVMGPVVCPHYATANLDGIMCI
jgi:hypothetical protein